MFVKFLAAVKNITELQKLQMQLKLTELEIKRINNKTYHSEKGVYGTASAEYSEDMFRKEILLKQLDKIKEMIDNEKHK